MYIILSGWIDVLLASHAQVDSSKVYLSTCNSNPRRIVAPQNLDKLKSALGGVWAGWTHASARSQDFHV